MSLRLRWCFISRSDRQCLLPADHCQLSWATLLMKRRIIRGAVIQLQAGVCRDFGEIAVAFFSPFVFVTNILWLSLCLFSLPPGLGGIFLSKKE